MDGKVYRVCVLFTPGSVIPFAPLFEGGLERLRQQFPVQQYPKPLFRHIEDGPRGHVTFLHSLEVKVDGVWKSCDKDPRLIE